MNAAESLLLRGRDHARYGEIEVGAIALGRMAAALSVGSDRSSPSLSFKRRPDTPNEDAVLVAHDGKRSLLAVADAHFGAESSHVLLARLRQQIEPLPEDPEALIGCLRRCALREPPTEPESATTLLVVVVDHARHELFGLSFGDSQLFVAGTERFAVEESRVYVTPFESNSLRPELAHRLHRRLEPGALVAVFTDGVHECHYRQPQTSLQAAHVEAISRRVGPEPRRFVRALTEAALAGVDGHPGGQDNVAVAALVV